MTSLRKDLEGRQEQLERSHAQLVELQNKYDVCPKPEVVERYVEGWGGGRGIWRGGEKGEVCGGMGRKGRDGEEGEVFGGVGRRERYVEGWGGRGGMWRRERNEVLSIGMRRHKLVHTQTLLPTATTVLSISCASSLPLPPPPTTLLYPSSPSHHTRFGTEVSHLRAELKEAKEAASK